MASFVTTTHLNGRVRTAPSERRASVRFACKVNGAWRPIGSQGAAWPALLQDISEGGINLLMDSTFQQGTVLAVMLECPLGRFKRPVHVRVAHCKEQDHGLWSVGCAFTSRLNKLELLALLQFSATLTSAACADPVAERPEAKRVRQPQQSGHPAEVDPFTAGSPSERRRTPRRGGDSVAVSIHRAGSSDRPIEGWVVNRSLGGLCVCSPKSFADDSILKIRARRGSEAAPTVEVRVRGSREEGQRWMMHCQYTIQPSAATMLMFG